jgi:hypothetical protein
MALIALACLAYATASVWPLLRCPHIMLMLLRYRRPG